MAEAAPVHETGSAIHRQEVSRQVVDEMRAHRAELHRCFERVLARSRKLSGEVLLQVTRAQSGDGQKAQVLGNSSGDEGLGSCAARVAGEFALADVLRPGEAVAFPVHFRAPAAQFTVRAADAPPLGPPAAVVESRILVDDETMVEPRLSVLLLRVRPGARLAMHRHPRSSETLYVLSGRGRIASLGEAAQALQPGVAVHFSPGNAHTIEVAEARVGEGTPMELLQIFVPGGPERRLRDPAALSATEVVRGPSTLHQAGRGRSRSGTSAGVAGAEGAGPRQPVVVCVVCRSTAIPVGGGARPPLRRPGLAGTDGMSLGLLHLEAAGRWSLDRSAPWSETLYVLAGAGRLEVAGEELPLEPGMAVHLPRGVSATIEAREAMAMVEIRVSDAPATAAATAPPAAAPARAATATIAASATTATALPVPTR